MARDHGFLENFFPHLRSEMYHQHTFGNRLAARTAAMECIGGWYNRCQPNRRAGGIPPAATLATHQTRDQEPLAA